MKELRLIWEPENKTPLSFIEERMSKYMKGKKSGVSILANGSLLFTPNDRDYQVDARKAMNEARFLIDFKVVEMKDGGYIIEFHHALAVFVSEDEFKLVRNEIKRRLSDLKFPEEYFFSDKKNSEDDYLIGLYARGKLQYDAHHFSFYKRV